MKKLMSVLAAATVLATSGCASLRSDATAPFRVGYVAGVYAEREVPANLLDCLARLDERQLAGTRFVRLRYGLMRFRKTSTVLAPANMQLSIHDRVEFGPLSCEEGDLPRIIRVVNK